MPGVGIQVPPNLADWWPELAAGATDLGGPVRQRRSISPEHLFPSPHQVRRRLAEDGVALAERLCVPALHRPRVDRPARARRDPRPISPVHPRAAARRHVTGDAERARAGRPLDPDELAALFAESRPEVIEDMPGRRRAARRAGGDTVTFVVNRNINVSNVCIVGCAFCGFGVGRRRSPDAYEHDRDEFSPARTTRSRSGRPRSACSRASIRTGARGLPRLAAAGEGDGAAAPPARLQPDGDRAHVRHRPPAARRRGAVAACGRGLDPVPGTAAEVLDDGVRQRISPNKLPVARWVEIIEAAHGIGLRLYGDGDVRPRRVAA